SFKFVFRSKRAVRIAMRLVWAAGFQQLQNKGGLIVRCGSSPVDIIFIDDPRTESECLDK
ncbi:TPA: hypothetical protein ACYLM8_008703, partial [Burkholderia lata]